MLDLLPKCRSLPISSPSCFLIDRSLLLDDDDPVRLEAAGDAFHPPRLFCRSVDLIIVIAAILSARFSQPTHFI
jgi:hypothetical protein